MKRFLLMPLAASVAVGCGVDFSAPLLDTDARFTAHLELVDSLGVGQARLSGSLWPGFTESGNVRFVADSSFELLGRTILPLPEGRDTLNGVAYAEQWGLNPEIPPGEIELRAPDVPGIGVGPPVFRLTPPWRAGPANLTVAAGSGLRLDLLVQPAPADTVYESWWLDLRNGDGHYVGEIRSTGPTPAGIDVPWPLLAALGSGGEIHLVVQQAVVSQRGRYVAAFQVTTRHVWSVAVEP
jgi:hypothetical protein